MAINRIDAKMRTKRSTVTGEVPTIGPSQDYTDGTWSASTMIYPGEFFLNLADEKLWIGGISGVTEIDLQSSGTTDYDFCTTGIKTSAISGCTNDSIVIAGQGNSATTQSSSVIGGENNLASGPGSFIGGGGYYGAYTTYGNIVSGDNSAIVGGLKNVASYSTSFIGGGYGNTSSGTNSFIGGGLFNIASGTGKSGIIGGEYNIASGSNSGIIGGDSNSATTDNSFVGGGNSNKASGVRSSVIGGNGNLASTSDTHIGGGSLNTASGQRSSVIGGYSNLASGTNSFIGGGQSNTASGTHSFVGGGKSNSAGGVYSFIGGGAYNFTSGDWSQADGFATSATSICSHSGGLNAKATKYGEWTRSSNVDSQYGIQHYYEVYTSGALGTLAELFIGNQTNERLVLETGDVYRVNVTAIARDTTSGDIKEWGGFGLFKNVGGTVSEVGAGTLTSTYGDASLSTATLTINADNTNKSIFVEALGVALLTIEWTVKIDYLKLNP